MLHSARVQLLGLCVLAGALLAACGGGGGSPGGGGPPPPTATPSGPTPTPPLLPPSGQIYLGAYVNTSNTSPPLLTDTSTFEALIGRKLVLHTHYYGFYDDFPSTAEADDLANGRIPIESWNCQVPNASIASGASDALLQKRAAALAAYGHPIFVRYMWEMNLPANPNNRALCWDPNSDNPNFHFSPANYVGAWLHMRQVFQASGATNVIWLWNPSGSGTDPIPYYPGPSAVDWVGFDEYDDANQPFDQVYAAAYSVLQPLGKPIVLVETGATTAQQPIYFPQAVPALQSTYPQIKAYMYFDAIGHQNNWILTGVGLEAFATMAGDPYLAATPPAH